MKKRTLQIIFFAIFLFLSINCLSPPYAFADTDGSEISVAQPERLEIQLGSDWIGAEFQLRTDYGLYPALIPVGGDGVLRLEIGGSSSYILSCVSTGRTSTVVYPSEHYTPATTKSVPSYDPVYSVEPVTPAPEQAVYPVSVPTAPPASEPAPVYSPEDSNIEEGYFETPYNEEYYEYEEILIAGIPLQHILFFGIGLLICVCILVVLRVKSIRLEEDDDEFDDNDE